MLSTVKKILNLGGIATFFVWIAALVQSEMEINQATSELKVAEQSLDKAKKSLETNSHRTVYLPYLGRPELAFHYGQPNWDLIEKGRRANKENQERSDAEFKKRFESSQEEFSLRKTEFDEQQSHVSDRESEQKTLAKFGGIVGVALVLSLLACAWFLSDPPNNYWHEILTRIGLLTPIAATIAATIASFFFMSVYWGIAFTVGVIMIATSISAEAGKTS